MKEILQTLQRLQREMDKLTGKLEEIAERVAAVAGALSEIEAALAGAPPPALLAGLRSVRAHEENEHLLRDLAEQGVSGLEVNRHLDGAAAVRIGGGKWFGLPPMLVDLLEILAAADAPSAASIVPWKARESVQAALAVTARHAVSDHGLAQLLSRLRKRLHAAGVNPWLVQRNRDNAMRFALVMDAD